MAKKISSNNRDNKLHDSEDRAPRETQERTITEDRTLSDDERLAEFQMSYFQSALPDIPPIDGYHVCWLTTENPRDPIHARMRLGYEPIKASDIPGWDHASLKTGEWAGCIGVNEMIAFKLPISLYERYMKYNHHDQPLSEEGKLDEARRLAEEGASAVARRPVSFELEEGNTDMGEAPEPPSFEDTLTNRQR